MSQTRKSLNVLAATVLAVFTPLLVISAPAPSANICNTGELWEGLCLTTQEWEAGWYLHPDNDLGDGEAVKVAYNNYPLVIQTMPHSMCVDWRTANCDGTTPPPQPERAERKSDRRGDARKPASLDACVKQANTQPSLSSSCLRFYNYDTELSEGDPGYDADLLADARAFLSGVRPLVDCQTAAAFIQANGAAYTAGTLSEPVAKGVEDSITIILSWSCRTRHGFPLPTIPSPPSQ